ncbi:hypothetical protein ACSBR2_026048 [Camellia fascicularis]
MQPPLIHHTKPTIIQDSSKSPAFTGSSLTSASNTWQQQSPGCICKLDVDSLKEKLLEKLEQFIVNLELDSREASTREFVEVVCAYWVIFPESEQQLIKLAQDLLTRCYLLST